jgi:hypothetical protein
MQRLEALTCAMALAPGVYARNRMFDLFTKVALSHARRRAMTLRGIVRHLGHACAVSVLPDNDRCAAGASPGSSQAARFILRYQIPQMSLERASSISRLELAIVRLLATRAQIPCLPASDADRTLVQNALMQLLLGNDEAQIAKAD